MQISTSLFYDTASRRMSSLTDRANVLQEQISTGKKQTTPSQDAALAQQVAELDRQDADAAVYKTNLTLAGSQLDQTDSTLSQIQAQIQRAQELATQAATGTQNDDTRKIIGNELATIADALVGLANTRDVRGQMLFGTPTDIAAVTKNADSGYTFASNSVSPIPIAAGQSVQANESAARIFKNGDKDTLSIITQLAAALQAGGDVSDTVSKSLDDLNAANDQVSAVRASVGARGARVDLQTTLLSNATTDRAALREKVENVDVTSAIAELQKTMTILSATQASFTKLASLSLFDYLK